MSAFTDLAIPTTLSDLLAARNDALRLIADDWREAGLGGDVDNDK